MKRKVCSSLEHDVGPFIDEKTEYVKNLLSKIAFQVEEYNTVKTIQKFDTLPILSLVRTKGK